MIRVLQCVNDMHRAGLETMLMNYYRNIDRNEIQFDFLTHRPYKSDYDDEIISLGGKVYYAPRLYPQNYFHYFKWMKQFFKEHPEYQIVHSHIDAMSFFPLLAAKRANVPIRIAHSHSASIDRDFKYFLKLFFKSQLPKVANTYCACGKKAGKFLMPKKNYTYIPNAIEINKFLFNSEIRQKKRNEMEIKDELVLGHVGRMSYPKNHEFLIDVFLKILEKRSNSLLILVGVGEKFDEIKKYVNSLEIADKVKFLGNRRDVNELYQAMDVFVMPSLFEGIPLVGVEAQFAGLPCVFSNEVTTEIGFTYNVQFIPLNEDKDVWADKILYAAENCKDRKIDGFENSEFNISKSALFLENYYKTLIKNMIK